MMEGSPVLIEQLWPGIPAPIDAAVFYDGSFITFLLWIQQVPCIEFQQHT